MDNNFQTSTRVTEPVLVLFSIFECRFYNFIIVPGVIHFFGKGGENRALQTEKRCPMKRSRSQKKATLMAKAEELIEQLL
ncbi:MAG TPA: hypothetical protein VI755_06870, partial [Anaerolineales bacterium]|nr:hypothetical protein [Anaerolineales bacterium]